MDLFKYLKPKMANRDWFRFQRGGHFHLPDSDSPLSKVLERHFENQRPVLDLYIEGVMNSEDIALQIDGSGVATVLRGLRKPGGWKKLAVVDESYGHLERSDLHEKMRELSKKRGKSVE